MTLDAVEFIRRFLLHIVPAGFVRIRQYGFLANRARGKKLKLCRDLLAAVSANSKPADDALTARETEKEDRRLCPVCKLGHMIQLEIILPVRVASLSTRQDSS